MRPRRAYRNAGNLIRTATGSIVRLLIVEDNERIAGVAGKLLEERAFAVDRAACLADALGALDVSEYDLILLDLSLPDGDGIDVLRKLRQRNSGMPVIVMTARAEVAQRVQTLDEGADDYLVKPFSLDELLARVRAVLRRPRQIGGAVLTAGNVTLDTTELTLTVAGAPVEIPSRREIGVLTALLARQGRLLPKQKLVEAVYSFDQDVTPNAVEQVVSRLRRRLEVHGATVTITAMRGLGYILATNDASASVV
jgi:DNA-binding response OmpR family regulator